MCRYARTRRPLPTWPCRTPASGGPGELVKDQARDKRAGWGVVVRYARPLTSGAVFRTLGARGLQEMQPPILGNRGVDGLGWRV